MKRDISSTLINWKNSPKHLPIILRGARQIGKSYSVQKLGKEHFEQFVEVNFEFAPEYKNCFRTNDPTEIIKQIELISNKKITAGKTLLFLDEIQECPEAIVALRYFKEMMPNLHVISAGSLLEFVLNEQDFRMPVGRVQFMHMYPLSFKEFLDAKGESAFRKYIEEVPLIEKINPAVHEKGLRLVKEYCFVGGMPAVVKSYLRENSYQTAQETQGVLITTYQNDFGKYARTVQIPLLTELYQKLPSVITQQFKYARVIPEVQSRDIKNVLEQLIKAGIVHQIFSASAEGLPLSAKFNKKKFKLLFLDTGLVNRSFHTKPEVYLTENLMLLNQGALVEHFVGQELISKQDRIMPEGLYFWARDKLNSNAEIDYLTTVGDKIIPIEVKSGKTGRMKSLHLFMELHQSKIGIRISQNELATDGKIVSIPLYLTSETTRLIKQFN